MNEHNLKNYMAITQCSIYRNILKTLIKNSPLNDGDNLPPPEAWPSTRQIADANDISIYKARLLLLELVEHKLVIAGKSSGSNSLRWYPLASNISMMKNYIANFKLVNTTCV